MKKVLTLLIIHKDSKVLLGMKKRGFGMGKWNGFGGKVEKGETVEEAAQRELFEESGLSVNTMKKIGVVNFSWINKEDVLEVHYFASNDFAGQAEETEEMKPRWFLVNEIPFEKMWPDDKYWFPLFWAGKTFIGKFIYDDDNNIVKQELKVDSEGV